MEGIITAVSITGLMWVLINYIELVMDWSYRRKWEKQYDFIKSKLCLKCFATVFALIYTQDFLIAGLTGLIAYLIDAHVLKKKIEL